MGSVTGTANGGNSGDAGNAFLHAGRPLQLRIHHGRAPSRVTVAVADPGAGEPRMQVPGQGSGRGLWLVNQLSHRWGVSRHDDGKLV
ncbi:ATP-binding protein [Amycolatopsis sp. OK19-0408]|uniref:ATP-binding protein n=1 Tax=Amycolatopsis iheyensis TaxID=2945988 RepID=A0A9X2NNZ1_9PSEU|nr:ATP-binding protein [Amycolatopsis iheyensis]MCR6490670.1 ATP-binding protein [Amycolatopsis iheyensis]